MWNRMAPAAGRNAPFKLEKRLDGLARAVQRDPRNGGPRHVMPAYDPQNVFAKILRGEVPCHKVYEDEKTFAFMDVMPRADGHVLVIPKNPARTILDAAPDDLCATY